MPPLPFLIICGLFIFFAVWANINNLTIRFRRMLVCKEHITAQCINVDTYRTSKSTRKSYTWQYNYDGQTHSFTTTSPLFRNDYQVGDKMDIRINICNPAEYYTKRMNPVPTIIYSLLKVGGAVVSIYVCYKYFAALNPELVDVIKEYLFDTYLKK